VTTNAAKRRERLSAQDARTRAERYAASAARRAARADERELIAAEPLIPCVALVSTWTGHGGIWHAKLVEGERVEIPFGFVALLEQQGLVRRVAP
jgi:hypothetical protein